MHGGICVDFYLPSLNTIIEVNGIQHYQPSSFGRDSVDTVLHYTKQLNRDDKLRNVCSLNGIKLVEIPYTFGYNQILTQLTELKHEYNGN
jgi:hypothetical protein